jgi:hypothetical protein
MMLKIKDDIQKGKELQTGFGWILWYIPVLVFAVAWTYREFFVKKPKAPTE